MSPIAAPAAANTSAATTSTAARAWLAPIDRVSASAMTEPAKQALRPQHQHHDHDGEHDRIGPHRRDVERADGLNLRERQSGDHHAGDAADAADNDHREG